jgi:hypothetical protein
MFARMLLLTALCASGLATAQPDGGPRRGTEDAGTKGTTVPDRPTPPPGGAQLPAPRTQTTAPVGTGSETPPPARTTPPTTPKPHSELPSPTQPPSPTPH